MMQVWTLIKKDFLLDWRQKHAVWAMVLYAAIMIFVVYLAFLEIESNIWSGIFWIILLFAAVNAVTKSFMGESDKRQLYYYSLHTPTTLLTAKLVYNVLTMLFLSAVCAALFFLVFNNKIRNLPLFFVTLALGAISFASCLTMVSAITSRAKGNATLMAILSFPVIIPIMLLLILLTADAYQGKTFLDVSENLMILGAIDLIQLAITFLLFPYLWRD